MITPSQVSFTTTKPMPENAELALRFLFSMAHFIIVDTASEMMPVFAIEGADGERRMLDVSDIPGKHLQVAVVRHAAEQLKAVVAAMVSEGWTLPQELLKERMENRESQGLMSEHPEAFEVLILHVETPEGVWMGQVPIAKDDTGVRSLSTEMELHAIKLEDAHGAMTGFLPEVLKAREAVVKH